MSTAGISRADILFTSKIASLVRDAEDNKMSQDLSFFSCLTSVEMRETRAKYYLVEVEDDQFNINSMIRAEIRIIHNKRVSSEFKLIKRELAGIKGQFDGPSVHGKILSKNALARNPYPFSRSVEEIFGNHGIEASALEEIDLALPVAQLIGNCVAIAPILGLDGVGYGLIILERDPDDGFKIKDLLSLTLSTFFLNQAFSIRDVIAGYGKFSAQIMEMVNLYGENTELLLLIGPILIGISHDLLRSHRIIKDFTNSIIYEIPESKKKAPGLSRVINELKQQLEFKGALIKRTLQPARIANPIPGRYDIVALTHQAVMGLRGEAERIGVDINITTDGLNQERKRVVIDEVLYSQVISNLVDNSIYWIGRQKRKKGNVRINLSEKEGEIIEIDYRDTGPGIVKDIRAKSWEPFKSWKPNGVGLGLYIVKRIVEDVYKGTIEYVTRPKFGACFRIRIPLEFR